MPSSKAAPSRALQNCFDEVADSAPMALERCLNQVVSVLQDAELRTSQATERVEFGEAWRELLQHQAAWCKRYPDELRAVFAAGRNGAAVAVRGAFEPGLELALVDESAIQEEIESSRLIRHVMPLVEQPVSELDALVSSAMGLETVQPELNPVRPEVFAQTLRTMIGRTQVKPATGTLWLRYLAEPLGLELQTLYGRLVVQLKDANVQAAEYRVSQTAPGPQGARRAPADPAAPDAASNPGTAAAASDAGAPRQAPWVPHLSGQQITYALLRDFLAHGGGARAAQALPPSYYVEAEREITRLKALAQGQRGVAEQPAPLPAHYREAPPVDRPQRAVGIQSTLNTEVWGDYAQSHERSMVRAQLRKDAKQVAQVLGLELVRKVVNQIAQDPRLLAPVREAIVALEPALLRLAMVDPRFFSEERHPGRLLMERVARRSFKYNDEFADEFVAFFDGVSRCFNGLNQAQIADAKPFEEAVGQLETSWTAQDRLEADPRVKALRAMQFAEKRQAAADHIAWELSSRPDLRGVPAVVQDFLFGPWALVLAHARLTDTAKQIDPHGYLAVIPDLLWSVKPEVTLRQPAQLFERLPALLGMLRAGLASIDQEPEESELFFHELMKLHRPVLKLRRAKSRRDARESGMAPLESGMTPLESGMTPLEVESAEAEAAAAAAAAEPARPRDKEADGEMWLSARELDALGFQETMPTGMGELWEETAPPSDETGFAQTQQPDEQEAQEEPSPAPAQAAEVPQADIDVTAILLGLHEGDWVDLYSKRQWLRAQLIWASSRGTLFMFVSHGGRPHSMTKRICERLIRERFLRPVRMHGVVEGALNALEREDAPA